jgi:hypothetical protein
MLLVFPNLARPLGPVKNHAPPGVQLLQDLLRITPEAISNAVRHARPTIISVSLRRSSPNLVLRVLPRVPELFIAPRETGFRAARRSNSTRTVAPIGQR